LAQRLPIEAGRDNSPPAPTSSGASPLDAFIADLADLDAGQLRLQWRNHLGGTPPGHLPRWLLARVLAHRLQAATLGDLDKATLRVIRQSKGGDESVSRPFAPLDPATRDGVNLKAGSLLVREWNGALQRVMVLDEGFAWGGETYGSLSQIAKAMTGTNWNGHRFFGLRPKRSGSGAETLESVGAPAIASFAVEATHRPRASSSSRASSASPASPLAEVPPSEAPIPASTTERAAKSAAARPRGSIPSRNFSDEALAVPPEATS